jgi:iron complex outermembrane receptor protein
MKKPSAGLRLRPIARGVAIATAGVTTSVGSALAQDGPVTLDEIIVTATKREMNMQDVPQSIQAFATEEIEKLGLVNMAEYIKVIPALSTVTTSPGRNEVVFRGVSTGTGEWRTDSGTAVYLGDIPMTSATQAVDPRTVDLARIESLPGPQGTLFGSSSQSGALRVIPNAPDVSAGYGSVDVGGTYMREGEPGYKVEGWVNLALIPDKLAIRAVLFDTRTGGYIDNVLGSNIFTPETNEGVVEKDFNDWKQRGGRIAALWNISDTWSVELMYMDQWQKSEGDWKSDPNAEGVDELEIVRFHKDVREDDWWITAATLTGDIGFAEFKSITSVLDRKIFYEFDGNPSGQIRAQRVRTPGDSLYYNVWYDTAFQPETAVNDQTAKRWTQEFRLASYGESRLQWMLGAFYEETEDKWDYAFSKVENLRDTPFGQYWDLGNYIPDTDVWYKEDYESTTKQVAVFGELSYQITDALTATVGARWFQYDRDRSEVKSWPEGNPYDVDIYKGKDDDTLYKMALNYSLSDDKMIYFLASPGFRLGGPNSIKNPSSVLPDSYGPDTLNNFEAGLKSQWLGGRLQVNASVYSMDWQDIQRGITDPDDWTANGTVNMGDATVSGLELNVSLLATERLKIDASYAHNKSDLKEDYFLSDIIDLNDPSQDYQMGAKGQELAIAPPNKWWIGVEYTVPGLFGSLDAWVRYDHSWRDAMYHDWWNALNAETGYGGKKLIDAASEASLQLGIDNPGGWSLTLSIWNVWDDRNAQWISSGYDYWLGEQGVYPGVNRYVNMPYYNRPRELELTFTKRFSF